MTLLQDTALIVAVTRRLLGDSRGELCAETVERIAYDISKDQISRRAVAVAHRNQVSETPKQSRELPPSILGTVQLRSRDGTISLEAAFPPIQQDIQSRLRKALRRRRYAARLWGVSAPVPSVQLLSCLPFIVKLIDVPPEGADLLPNLDQIKIDPELRDVLAAFELRIDPPLLFSVSADETQGRQIRGPVISGDRKYWLLSDSSEDLRNCAELGEVGPFRCHLLDPGKELEREILRELGFQVRFGISVEFAGSPPLVRDASIPEFAVNDQLTIAPRRVPPNGLHVQLHEQHVCLAGDEVARIAVGQGEHTLQVSNGEENRDYLFQGTPLPKLFAPVTCFIGPCTNDLSVQALLGGKLEFEIECSADLHGLALTLEIKTDGRNLFATAPLGPLPCIICSDQEPFVTLLNNDETRELLPKVQSLSLRLSVGHLCSCTVELEHRVQPCWWAKGDDDSAALTSEFGDLPIGRIPATNPATRPLPVSNSLIEEAQLLAPIELDALEFGDAAQFTTLCIAPSKLQLDPPVILKPRLARRRRAGNGALGLEDIVESYLRWSLAESCTIIAEIRRRQVAEELDGWIAEICCGEEWVRRETAIRGVDPWEELTRICDATGFGRDPYIELSRKDEIEVTRIAVQEVRLELPGVWARVGPKRDLRPEDYEALDLACGRAYSKLAQMYRGTGREDMADSIGDGDPGAAPDEWDAILESVKSTSELEPLAEMLFPSDMAHGLMAMQPSMMTLDELTEELTWWARDSSEAFAAGVQPTETLRTILGLWIEPVSAVERDWRGALDVLIAERTIARAVRYLALRSRRTARKSSTR